MTKRRMNAALAWMVLVAVACPLPAIAQTGGENVGSIVEIDRDGMMLLNGERTFVYGLYRDPSDDWRRFDGIRQTDANLTHSYRFEDTRIRSDSDLETYIADAQQYLDLAHRHEVGVALGLPRHLVWDAELETLERIITAVRDKPALWFWYLMDEPRSKGEPEALKQCYALIKKLDPNHPVVLVDNVRWLGVHGDAADLLWVDVYSVPWGIKPLVDSVERVEKLHPDKPVWLVASATAELAWARSKSQGRQPVPDAAHRPNPKEIRAVGHGMIAGGSQAAIYWLAPNRWQDIRTRTPKIWRSLVDLGTEFRTLLPALESSEPVPPVNIEVEYESRQRRMDRSWLSGKTKGPYDEPNEIVAWKRMHEGSLYIGIVNAGYQTQISVTIDLPFEFERIVQYPDAVPVIEHTDQETTIHYDRIPVVVRDIEQRDKIRIVMNEADTVVWRIDPAP